MKKRSIISSFNYAVNGIILALKSEKHMRFHYIIALGVIISSLFFDFSKLEFLILLFATSLVIVAEMLNTAIEKAVDMITKDYHPLARVAKDIAAGAVLIASLNALIVAYLLFFERLNNTTDLILFKIGKSPVYLTFVALLVVVILVIGFKAKFYKGKGTHFQGGAVSGHAAVAFCVATIVSFLSHHILVTTLSYFLALLVGESRIEGKIHSITEVVFGAVLGSIIGVLIFQLLG